MLTLGATVITLAFLTGVIEPQSVLNNLPVNQSSVDTAVPDLHQPPNVPVTKPSSPTRQPPKGHPAGGTRGKCPVMASYMLSAEKLQKYLNSTMPAKMKELVQCSDVNLAGLMGSLLNTLTATDLLSALPLDITKDILPLELLDNVLGKGDAAKPKGNANAPDAPALPAANTEAVASPVSNFLPGEAAAEPVSELTGQVSSKVNDIPGSGPVKGVLSNGVPGVTSKLKDVTDSAGGLLKSTSGKNLGNAVSQVKGPTEKATDLVSNVLAPDSSTEASGAQGGLDVSGLLLALKVGKVSVDSMNYSMTDDGVEVQATVTADVQSEGVAGTVISTVGFQVKLDLTMIITSTHNHTNNTVQLEVEQKTMEVKKVTIKLVETVTNALPLPVPVPVPLDSVVLTALSVELTQNAKESSCGIVLSEIDSAKNETGVMCLYTIDSTKISAKGLHIYFCGPSLTRVIPGPEHVRKAKCSGINNSSWVSGSRLADHPKNDSVSVIVSHKAVREHVTRCVAQVDVKEGNMEAFILKLSYKYPSDGIVEAVFKFQLKMNGMDAGIVVLGAQFSHKCRIENGKLVADIKLQSTSLHSSTIPETVGEMTEAMKLVVDKTVSSVTECLGKWNFPTGLSTHPVSSARITVLKTDDLHAGK